MGFFHYSTHAFSVAEAVELARSLDQLPAHLVVYGIEGANFAAGVELSPAVEQAVEAAVERLAQEIRDVLMQA
jgi:hydrogenase maturation protease